MNRGDVWLIRIMAKVVFPVYSWLANPRDLHREIHERRLYKVIAPNGISIAGPGVEPIGYADLGKVIWAERWFGESHPDVLTDVGPLAEFSEVVG